MPNQDLLKYIKDSLAQNVSKEEIKRAVLEVGWAEADIATAFLVAEGGVAPIVQPEPATVVQAEPTPVVVERAPAQSMPMATMPAHTPRETPRVELNNSQPISMAQPSPHHGTLLWVMGTIIVALLVAGGIAIWVVMNNKGEMTPQKVVENVVPVDLAKVVAQQDTNPDVAVVPSTPVSSKENVELAEVKSSFEMIKKANATQNINLYKQYSSKAWVTYLEQGGKHEWYKDMTLLKTIKQDIHFVLTVRLTNIPGKYFPDEGTKDLDFRFVKENGAWKLQEESGGNIITKDEATNEITKIHIRSIQKEAEPYYDKYSSYGPKTILCQSGLFSDPNVASALSRAKSASGYAPQCYNDGSSWAVSIQLKDVELGKGYFCLDAQGSMGMQSKPLVFAGKARCAN